MTTKEMTSQNSNTRGLSRLLIPIAFMLLGEKSFAIDQAGFLSKVLAHPKIANIEAQLAEDGFGSLQKVEKTQTYRCPGCFRWEMTYIKFDQFGNHLRKFQVYSSLNGEMSDLNIRVVEE